MDISKILFKLKNHIKVYFIKIWAFDLYKYKKMFNLIMRKSILVDSADLQQILWLDHLNQHINYVIVLFNSLILVTKN